MRGDPSARNRSVLLTRWRAAPAVVHESSPALAASFTVTPAPATSDEAALFSQFEAEIRASLSPAMATTLLRMLSASRTAVLAARSPATCAASLRQLDLLEDVLDALLLSDTQPSQPPEGERRAP